MGETLMPRKKPKPTNPQRRRLGGPLRATVHHHQFISWDFVVGPTAVGVVFHVRDRPLRPNLLVFAFRRVEMKGGAHGQMEIVKIDAAREGTGQTHLQGPDLHA